MNVLSMTSPETGRVGIPCASKRWRRVLVALGLMPVAAMAFRPFDSTDADVAKLHEVEIEFSPVGYLKDGKDDFLIAPALAFNYGLAPGTEVVAEGTLVNQLDSGDHDARVEETGLFVKHLWRAGSLQDQRGLSVATEAGLLLPEPQGDGRVGFSVAGIASQKWSFGAVHFNLLSGLTRAHNPNLFAGAIFEGPERWRVRPVAEIYVEHEYTVAGARSVLIGAIWQYNEDLAFDFGLRGARDAGQNVREVRAGLTWSFEP